MTDTDFPPPEALRERGRAFWDHTLSTYDLSRSEVQMLAEICRTLDTLDELAGVVARDGATVTGSMGQTVVHPALGEARGQRQVMHKLLAALSLPDVEDGTTTLLTPRQAASKASSRARWSGQDTEAARRRRSRGA